MENFQINISKEYHDAIIISEHIAEIWNDKVDKNNYDKMYSYIKKYREGFLIAYLFNEAIGSSIAFPINRIPSFDEINNKNIYDLLSIKGKYFYIHIIQIIERFRNKGYGIKLLKYQINTAKRRKYKEIIAMGIDKELDLWKRCGFQEFGEYGLYKNYGRFKWMKMIL